MTTPPIGERRYLVSLKGLTFVAECTGITRRGHTFITFRTRSPLKHISSPGRLRVQTTDGSPIAGRCLLHRWQHSRLA